MPNQKKDVCPICKKENLPDVNFCVSCRYPINVKKIDELSKEDLLVHISMLFDTIKQKEPLFADKETEEVYEELFNLNWLRPESALFGFLQMRILLDLKSKFLKYPILDVGCGDGIFTSILFGARLNKNYDSYESIDFCKSDIYNNYAKRPEDFLISKSKPFGSGMDIKANSVNLARELKTYDQVKVGDARKIPFNDESFSSVFSNMIDDIKREDLNTVFNEVNRVLKKDGFFVFITPTNKFREFLLYYNKAQEFKEQGDLDKYKHYLELDRGRSEWEPRDMSLWSDLFDKTSFEFVKSIEFVNKDQLQFWDTGLRPFIKHMMDLRNTLRQNEMLSYVKRIWVDVIKSYLFKLIENEKDKCGAFTIIVAKKI